MVKFVDKPLVLKGLSQRLLWSLIRCPENYKGRRPEEGEQGQRLLSSPGDRIFLTRHMYRPEKVTMGIWATSCNLLRLSGHV